MCEYISKCFLVIGMLEGVQVTLGSDERLQRQQLYLLHLIYKECTVLNISFDVVYMIGVSFEENILDM